MPEKGKRAVLLVSPLRHNAARQHADTLSVAVRDINPHAARCHNRIQRHFGIKIVVAPHTADRHGREHALDLAGILSVIAQVNDRIRFFPVYRKGHCHVIAVGICKYQHFHVVPSLCAAHIAVFYTEYPAM